MGFEIFGIGAWSYLQAILLMLCATSILLFVSFLFGKKEIILNEYFTTLFDVYGRTKLRKFWGALLFGFMYSVGILYLVFIKIAWYPAKWIRFIIFFIFYDKEKVQRQIDLEKLKDKDE